MRQSFALIILVLGSVLISFVHQSASYVITTSPNLTTLEWLKEEHQAFVKSSTNFQLTIEANSGDYQKIKIQFHALKRQFKGLEFIYYYLDPQTFSKGINGAPLPKLQKKVPDQTIIPPQGLQRIEEMIYNEESFEELQSMVVLFLKNLKTYNGLFIQEYVTDPVIFESLRYGIIRVNTMGITGFDAPGNADVSLKDAAVFFNSFNEILSHYKYYIPKPLFNETVNLVKKANQQLHDADFNTFDRFGFVKEVLDPLWRKSLEVQQKLQVELPQQRFSKLQRPVNYMANSLYATDFLNTAYFAEYQGDNLSRQVELGKQLFFDNRLSQSGENSCASCHNPKRAFTDGLPLSKNLKDGGPGKRNSPTLINSVFAERYFHDMRVDRLAFQMDHVVLNPIEFNTQYDTIISRLRKDKTFVEKMNEAYGKEGITKNTITNAMSSFIASLTSFNSTFDQMIRSDSLDLDSDIVNGFNLFMGKAACATCHFPPTFSGLLPPEYAESESEVLGVPHSAQAPYELDQDLGRYMNHILMEQTSFYKHAFKTPTVRNIKESAPYMHNGVYSTLEEVIDFYDVGGGIGLGIDVPNQTLPSDSLLLTEQEEAFIIKFLESLEDNPYSSISHN